MVSQLITKWIANASDENLSTKLSEYVNQSIDGRLSPRDTEDRTVIIRMIRDELQKRKVAA